MTDKRDNFLKEVLEQIKSKEAKKFVSAELRHHIKSAENEWIGKGLSEAEAEEKVVVQMGNPIKIGQQLNKLHRPRIDWLMIILLVTTLGLGFLPLMNLEEMYGNFAAKKALSVLIGAITGLVLMLFDYRKFKNLGWMFYGLGIFVLLVLLIFPNIFINGQPYFRLGPTSIESMMAIPFFYLAWASFFQNNKLKVWQFIGLFLLSLSLFLTISKISTPFIYFIMVFVMLWWSKFGRKTVAAITLITLSVFSIVGTVLWTSVEAYLKGAFLGFQNPEQYAIGAGPQYLLINDLLSKAGWFGHPTTKKFSPITHADFTYHTDLAFVSTTYYFGWLMGIALVILLSLFVARMVIVSQNVNDSYGKLLIIGGISLYSVQLIYNIGMSLGFLPLIEVSLPFISYGLTPTVFNAGIIGMVLSVYRRKHLTSESHFN